MEWLYIFVGVTLIIEVAFRALYFWKRGKAYYIPPKLHFKNMYIEPHPYLPYAYKRNFTIRNAENYRYPILASERKGVYKYPRLKTNNVRHVNGEDGGRNILDKKNDEFRINCIGASTTLNYLTYQDKNYSYPLCLERKLRKELKGLTPVVNNYGMGGWTSAELLINFLLNGVDAQPNILIIYHGYNDLGASLTPQFKSDYSHAIRDFGSFYQKLKHLSLLPRLPIAFYHNMISRIGGDNIRHSLVDAIRAQPIDYNLDFQGLDTYKRNLEHVIIIAQKHNIQVIMSTFVYYLYDDIKKKPVHMKLERGVSQENECIRELAQKYSCPLVDNDKSFPREDRYFVDSIHFSHYGMEKLAQSFVEPILKGAKKDHA